MEHKDHKPQQDSSGKFMNGFILGALIGAGIVFLLGTQKGKKIIKFITEEGLEGISGITDLIEDTSVEEYEKEFEEATQRKPVSSKKTHHSKPQAPKIIDDEVEENIDSVDTHTSSQYDEDDEHISHRITPSPRRFFKGIGRKN